MRGDHGGDSVRAGALLACVRVGVGSGSSGATIFGRVIDSERALQWEHVSCDKNAPLRALFLEFICLCVVTSYVAAYWHLVTAMRACDYRERSSGSVFSMLCRENNVLFSRCFCHACMASFKCKGVTAYCIWCMFVHASGTP
jgi:hypothetical protein